AVGLLDRRVDHLDHHWRDIDTSAIAFDIRNDRLVGNVEREIRIDGDLVTARRNLDVLIRHDRTPVKDGCAGKTRLGTAKLGAPLMRMPDARERPGRYSSPRTTA